MVGDALDQVIEQLVTNDEAERLASMEGKAA
jgi:hypothetical protein